MKNKMFKLFGASLVVFATMMASTATVWVIHQPKTPDSLM